MTKIAVRDVTLNVEVHGKGYPLVLMHGGPGADLHTLTAFRALADQFTLVFYDHRGNGRSEGAEVTSMSWENLTADADALREALGFDNWAVLGHSFGGHVALEYALRYPGSLSRLVLVDTGADHRWSQERAPELLRQRGFSPETVESARRFFNGEIEPREMFPILMKLGHAYNPYTGLAQMPRMLVHGAQTKMRPEALIYAATHFLKGWTVMDQLHRIQVPALVLAGREDFIFPPEHQQELAARIPNARLVILDRAGHNVHDEQTALTLAAVRAFLNAAQRAVESTRAGSLEPAGR